MTEFLAVGFVVATAIPLWLFARSSDRAKGTVEPVDPSAKAIIVPRTLSPAYYFFLQTFAKANSLKVIVDRRAEERRRRPGRVFADRRHNDRRGIRPATWQRADFVVAPAPGTVGDDTSP